MALSWRYGKRSKYRAAKVSQEPEDFYRVDPKKSSAENAFDIYQALCCRETREAKRLFLLNGLATLCQNHQERHSQSQRSDIKDGIGFTTEDLLYCLSASLVHTFTQIRAAALFTIRYVLATPKDIKIFNSMQLQHLVCRSIDVLLKNDDERVQALKLIRKMLAVSPEDVSPVLVRCLVSLANSGIEDGDNMLRACLAALCEIAILNPTLLIVCGGVTSITRNVLECHNPRIAESLCGVLLYLLECPETRNISGVRLDCLAAPYCDFTYRLGIMDKNKDARELRYTSCRLALLSVLRSWTGTIEFCDPSKPSGLKSIVDVLYLNQMEVRKAILDLVYELLGLPQPAWIDDYSVAMQTVDPSDFQDAWLLSNGFVAMEGRSILPSLAARVPNVCEQHLALQLYCFLETGLLNALVEVIVSGDAHLSVRATVLIAKILHLMHTHLPSDICSTVPALPTLISYAAKGNQHAAASISALQSYQKVLRNRPASCSLFLDSIIQGGSLIHTRLFRRELSAPEQLHTGTSPSPLPMQMGTLSTTFNTVGTLDRQRLDSVSSSDESQSHSSTLHRSSFRLKRKFLPFFESLRVNRLIKDSNVLLSPLMDGNAWDWEVVLTILRSGLIRKLDDTTGKFLKRLVYYFKPSSNRFSHQDLVPGLPIPTFVHAGISLIDWLLNNNELEGMRLLTDLFSDISQHLLAVTTSNRAHDCLFSPQHMSNTMCQQYFLFIGRMCRVQKGISILTNTAVFEHLVTLVRNTDHVCYVKLIVSGLDYSLDSVTRKVLEKALTSAKTRSGRLYATQFMLVLLRARVVNFEVWGIPMIIQQTKDIERSVVLAAMEVLEEACHEKYYLEEIVSLWPNLKPLGDVGRLLMAHYYSLSRGLNHRKAKIKEEIEYWKNYYNKRYVLLVEADTHATLTLHVRNEEGYYSRRNCNTRPIIIPPNIPTHLYGQMVQTAQGTTALRTYGDLPQLIDIINRGKCTDEAERLELKSAIWALGHASSHSNGIEYFVETRSRIYEKIVLLATKCDVYSIRATCFHALGIISSTNAGANLLFKLNWLSVRHDRNTTWPVHQPEDWISNHQTPIRHLYEEMPPYNYTGIEDQIDGSYYMGSYWNLLISSGSITKEGVGGGGASASSEAPDANMVEIGKQCEDNMKQITSTTAKSKTLPEGGSYARPVKHQRSLSESKTIDVISMIGGAAGSHHQHRIRHNSCTDSNTSGVSSCESVTGRVGNVVGEFQQFPLSPIPSMSNLLELPPAKTSLLRRTSLIGTSYLHHSISPVDIKGYAKLRSLRRHCRPVLSESAAELYDFIDRAELALYTSSFRSRKSSFGESQRRIKVRSLDRQLSLRTFPHLDAEEVYVPLPTLITPKFLSYNDSKGPCYSGICLPKNLLDLFPIRKLKYTYVSRDIQDQDLMDINLLTAKQQFLNDSLNNEGGDESSVISSLSDVSSVSKRSKWLGSKHGRGNCLYCSRIKRNRSHTQRLENETLSQVEFPASGTHSSVAFAKKAFKTQNQQQDTHHTHGGNTILMSDISFNSPESILSEESMPDRLTASILYNVQRLANPVSAKQSRIALLEMKQKHPGSFQDICLYSEVCKILGRASFRMNARRFLQELFLDLNFDSFFAEPTDILHKKRHDPGWPPFEQQRKANNSSIQKNVNVFKNYVDPIVTVKAIDEHLLNQTTTTDAKNRVNPPNAGSNATPVTVAIAATISGLPTTAAPSTVTSYTTTAHKNHLKSQPLASVYETSCENLLTEQMQQLQKPNVDIIKHETNTMKDKQKSNTLEKFKGSLNTELHITSDDDDEGEAEGETSEINLKDNIKKREKEDFRLHSSSSNAINTSFNVTTTSNTSILSCMSCNNQSQSFNSAGNNAASPISNSSEQTVSNSSNQSSICTISHHPQLNLINRTTEMSKNNRASAIIPENENKKFTRGRFYTLELDLSCTKNKFPITDRNRTSGFRTDNVYPINSLMTPSSVQRQFSLDSQSRALSVMQKNNTTNNIGTDNQNVGHSIELKNSDKNEIKILHSLDSNPSLTITKSLAASLAKPIGSLYCEKRLLQSSKSEALLTNVNSVSIATADSIIVPSSTTIMTTVSPCENPTIQNKFLHKDA